MNTRVAAVHRAAFSSNQLVEVLRTAHHISVQEDPLLEFLMRDLLTQAVALDRRLVELETALTRPVPHHEDHP
jgi:hypothetical protein